MSWFRWITKGSKDTRSSSEERMDSLGLGLVQYLTKRKKMDDQISALLLSFKKREDSYSRQLNSTKQICEEKLADFETLMRELAHDRATLQLENGKMIEHVEDARNSVKEEVQKVSALTESLFKGEQRIAELKKESERLEDVKKQLQIEKQKRMVCEHEISTLKQKMKCDNQLHEEEMKEATQRAQENITIHLPEDDDDLSEIIEEIRQQYNTKIQQLRSESASEIDTKIAQIREERIENEKLNVQLNHAQEQLPSLIEKTHHLESKLTEAKVDLAARDAQFKHLMETIQKQQHEINKLSDAKMKLENEFFTYRYLLKCEESRLSQVTPHSSPNSTPV